MGAVMDDKEELQEEELQEEELQEEELQEEESTGALSEEDMADIAYWTSYAL